MPDRNRLNDITALIAAINELVRPCEPIFLAIGEALGQAMGRLNTLDADFSALAGRLDSGPAIQAEQALNAAVAQCGSLVEGSTAISTLLGRMQGDSIALTGPMSSLRKITGEIGSLAINAKVQAAHIHGHALDFSVFTTEIGHLHTLADGAIAQADNRLRALQDTIATTTAAEHSLCATKVGEVSRMQRQLDAGIARFDQQRVSARNAMFGVGERSRQIAAKVADCIHRMQINDLTRQRIEHVREALELVAGVLDNSPALPEWTLALETGRRDALVAEICRLQSEQLDHAVRDFVTEVTKLKDNIHSLANEAEATAADARRLFADNAVLAELQADADTAGATLGAYAEAEAQVLGLIEQISSGFQAMVGDLDAINSIDADMRVMGLNASLKCGRLGNQGRALGVIAQELRGCSRRTQETASAIAEAIRKAADTAGSLAQRAEEGHTAAQALGTAIATSMVALRDTGDAIWRSLDDLVGGCSHVSGELGNTARGMSVHHDLERQAAPAVASLLAVARSVAVPPGMAESVQDDIRRLLEKSYTMASERVIHGIADSAAPAAASGEVDVDDFFF